MKLLSLLMMMSFLVSCASSKSKAKLQELITTEEVRSLKEIKGHSQVLLDSHPELSKEAKEKLRTNIDETIEKQQKLKDEESKVIQLLLSKTLRMNQLTEEELKNKTLLKDRLNEIYKLKAQNILSLTHSIKTMSDNQEISEGFERDMTIFMRDFR